MGGFALFEDGKYLGTLEDSNDWTVDEKDIARRILENYTNSSSVTNSVSQSEGDQPTEVITTVSLEGTRNHPEVQETQNLNVVSDIDSSKCLTEFLVANGLISITEDEIMEKSTGDALSKIVVVGQTLWFIVQCVARGIEGLVVTKLEISTLAFATLSFATYYFWWNKPQRVRFPVKIEIYPKKLDTTPKSTGNESFWKGIQSAWEAIRELTLFKYEEVDKIWDESPPTPIRIIIFPIVSLLQQCGDMVAGLTHFETGLEEVETPIWIYAPVISFAVVFGAIHSIAWSSESPSFRETAYWREGALLVTCLPILAMVLIKIEEILQRLPDSWGAILKTVLFMLLPWVYMLARTILVILALIELRALPFDAYRTVQWTNLIPHI
ncbi:hypothetical protein VKT23_007737 [Stygiomarasmius scandens]|uniref:Uncharacterized protein n=1 Tax=Marasmiellus scandens TaxID=2682957 RepID=A0ABR1JI96_9AGAR